MLALGGGVFRGRSLILRTQCAVVAYLVFFISGAPIYILFFTKQKECREGERGCKEKCTLALNKKEKKVDLKYNSPLVTVYLGI